MAKLIAFIGSPSSGKTTIALKTAMAAYMDKRTKNSRIVFAKLIILLVCFISFVLLNLIS